MIYRFEPQPRCSMCGSADSKLLGLRMNASQGRAPRRVSGIAVSVKKCRACELIYADPLPIPDQVTDHYDVAPEDYFNAERLASKPSKFNPGLPGVLELKPGMKALDIGAGFGLVMKALADRGCDVWGIEPSPSFAKLAVERMGIQEDRIIVSPMEDADIEESSFDLICMEAVLEHLYSPSEAVERALKWLKPGGILHIEVPSSRHLISKLLNAYYRLHGVNYVTHISPMHPPFHLYEFTHRSFAMHAQRIGGYELAAHRYWVATIYNVPRMFHPPLRWWMDRTGTGMQLIVWLKKSG